MKKLTIIIVLLLLSHTIYPQYPEWINYNSSNSSYMSSNSVRSIIIDESNNKWIGIDGSSGGLLRIDGVYWSYWTIYDNSNSGLQDNSLRSIATDENSNKWIGTVNGGIAKFDDQNWTIYNTSNSGLSDNYITKITTDEIGNKWIGTWNAGIVKFDDQDWTIYNSFNSGLPHNHITEITIDGIGNKWIGTWNAGMAKFYDQNWTVYDTSNSSLPSNFVRSIKIDGNGKMWIGTKGGLAKFDGTNWVVYNTSNSGLPDNNILTITIDESSNKWIGTLDHGLVKFDGTIWKVYNTSNSGLQDNKVQSIAIDESSNKWIGTYGGLSIYNELGVVPVELSLFTANVFDNSLMLHWQTETELNNLGFEIERSMPANKGNYIPIGFVEGVGNSTTPQSYSFRDQNFPYNTLLAYRLKQIDFDGTFTYSKEVEINIEKPLTKYSLEQNHPNPFNPITTINYTLIKGGFVKLIIFNNLGQEQARLVNEKQSAGNYQIEFDAQYLASGVYYYKILVDNFIETKKMIFMK